LSYDKLGKKQGEDMKHKLHIAVAPTVALLAVLAATTAFAQTTDDEIEPITVTAQRTGAQDVQRVPIAITVFTGGDLSKNVSNDIRDLAARAPNLTISQVLTSAQIYIRGIGSNNIAPGSDPDVTEQIDGVYIARPSAQLQDFIDVERVEILRGPQGTLYGRNAVGGTLNVISRLPTDEFVATNVLTAGNYTLIQDQAYVSGALLPGEVQASIAANYQSHDPYFHNIVPAGNPSATRAAAVSKGRCGSSP
jgi:iron complex outermembrane receptor protein